MWCAYKISNNKGPLLFTPSPIQEQSMVGILRKLTVLPADPGREETAYEPKLLYILLV